VSVVISIGAEIYTISWPLPHDGASNVSCGRIGSNIGKRAATVASAILGVLIGGNVGRAMDEVG
jgi:hypothetical protein